MDWSQSRHLLPGFYKAFTFFPNVFYLGCSSRNARNYICIEHRYLCLMINDVREKIGVDSYVRLRSARAISGVMQVQGN